MGTSELELNMEIEDGFRTNEVFSPDRDYVDFLNDTEFLNIEIYIRNGDETVGYLACTMFYDDSIEENGYDVVTTADDLTT